MTMHYDCCSMTSVWFKNAGFKPGRKIIPEGREDPPSPARAHPPGTRPVLAKDYSPRDRGNRRTARGSGKGLLNL